MNQERPVNLDLKTIRLPVTAIASILHRISAVIIWVALGVFLVANVVMLSSEQGYDQVVSLLKEYFLIQFVCWGFMTALGYYIVATLKHIIQDFGHFEELESGQMIAKAAIALGIVLSLLSGVWIWL